MKMRKILLSAVFSLVASLSAFALSACEEETPSTGNPPTTEQTGGGNSNDENQETKITVTYDANGGAFDGGDTTLTQTVNADTKLTAPTSPKRTNYTFAGWATDKNGGSMWIFDTDKPTENVTLYAIWREIIIEYDITFVLNYADADNVVKSTENGLITYVPVRDGYVFNGWWLSDGETENGYILSQKYDTTQRVTESNLTLYAEWVEEATASAQLVAPSITINQDLFSWEPITGAQSYNIRILENGNSETLYNQSVSGTSWEFPSYYEEGYYTVKIRANGDGETTVNSSFVTKSYAHRILNTISAIDFDISTSILTWTAVKYATEYELYLNNTFVDTLEQTIFDMSEYQAGEYEVKIIATRYNYQSSTTKKTIEKKRLKTPEITLQINDENNSYDFSWDTIYNANVYILTLNGTEIRLTDCAYSLENASTAWNGENTLTYSIKAFDENADYLVSNPTQEETFDKIYFLNVIEIFEDSETVSKVIHLTQNEETTITTARKGYSFLGWYDGETKLTDETSYTFTIPAENVTYTAKWEIATEMRNFNFTSTATDCFITGIINKTVREIIVPDYVTSINQGAFSGCYYLESMTIPFVGATKDGTSNMHFGYIFGASSYGYNKNYIPTSLKKVTITSETSIGRYAFYDCSSLTEILIPDSVTSIGSYAFSGCSSLTIYCEAESQPSGWNSNWNSSNRPVVWNCNENEVADDGYIYTVIDGIRYGLHLDGTAKVLTKQQKSIVTANMAESVEYKGNIFQVTSISQGAFSGCSELESITIPFVGATKDGTSYTHFGYIFGADRYYYNEDYVPTSLKKVTITSATSIGSLSFQNCSSLTEIVIPDSVTSIGASAFKNCSSLTSVVIGDNVTSIGGNAFDGCNSLTEIVIPDSVTSIGISAFKGCSSLTEMTLSFVGATKDGTSYTHFGYIFGASSSSYNDDYVPTSLKKVTITSATSIGSSAFSNCSNLTEIVIPDSVTSIGGSAFYDCDSLTEIVIPDSVTSIGDSAFSGCSSLTRVTCPAFAISYFQAGKLQTVFITSGNAIGDYAFRNCSNLTEIVIPDSVTSIGSYAFYNCDSLTEIVIPDSVTSIGERAFSGCNSLTEMTLPFVGASKSATSADSSTLFGYIFGTSSYTGGASTKQYYTSSDCINYYIPTSLKKVTITGGNILYGAFYNCSNLTEIVIPDSVTSIGSYAFYNCSSLTEVIIPNSVTELGEGVFSSCDNLTNVVIGDGVEIIRGGLIVGVFYGCSNLTNVVIGKGVKTIEKLAFYYCSSLTSITVSMDNTAYQSIDGNLYTKDGTTLIQYAIGKEETVFTIPDGVTSIGYASFGYSGLTKIIMPNTVSRIDACAFCYCSSLMDIVIPDSVTNIGRDAFTDTAYYADSHNWENEVLYIGNYLIKAKTYLSGKYEIKADVKVIAGQAFEHCDRLTEIVIPESVTSIGDDAFYYCSSLTSITVSENNTVYKSIDGNLYTKDGTTLIQYAIGKTATAFTIPDSVTSIGKNAFYGCSSLTIYCEAESQPSGWDSNWNPSNCPVVWNCSENDVADDGYIYTIIDGVRYGLYSDGTAKVAKQPSNIVTANIAESVEYKGITYSVTSIGGRAFSSRSSLTEIVIPDSVTSIGDYAFYYCRNLTKIVIPDSVTSIGSYAFGGCSNLTIYCEAESQPSGWNSDWNSSNCPVVWGYTGEE